MRLFKSRAEVETMRQAARIAAQAHVRAMKACVPGKREYEIAAEVVHEFRMHNADVIDLYSRVAVGATVHVIN